MSLKSSFLVNGIQCGYVHYRRGFRQEDPLSPLLFVLVVDVLSTMFNNTQNSGILHGISLGDRGDKMCHLQFVDDLLVMMTGGWEDLRIINLILYLFEGLSRLKVNFNKICLYSAKKNLEPQVYLARTLHYISDTLSLVYLGVLISGGRPRQDWDILIRKIYNRLAVWKSNCFLLMDDYSPEFSVFCSPNRDILDVYL